MCSRRLSWFLVLGCEAVLAALAGFCTEFVGVVGFCWGVGVGTVYAVVGVGDVG